MFRLLIALVLPVLWSVGAHALAQENEDLELALELIEVTDADALLEQMVPAIIAQQSVLLRRERPELGEAELRAFRDHLRAEIEAARQEFLERMAGLYLQHFTADELERLIAFYRTPVGKKSVEVMPQVMAKTIAMGDTWARQIGERARARYEATLE